MGHYDFIVFLKGWMKEHGVLVVIKDQVHPVIHEWRGYGLPLQPWSEDENGNRMEFPYQVGTWTMAVNEIRTALVGRGGVDYQVLRNLIVETDGVILY